MKIVYKIIYPNGKINMGEDLTNSINYFGSASSELISRDFSHAHRQRFTIAREVLWESETASDAEVNRVEVEFIRTLRANDPGVGYNKWPKLRDDDNRLRPSDSKTLASIPDSLGGMFQREHANTSAMKDEG